MSNADAARAETARSAARARWVERQGNPVLSRAVATVVERHADLDDSQRAMLGAAIEEAGGDD
jgi:hypothetical protein